MSLSDLMSPILPLFMRRILSPRRHGCAPPTPLPEAATPRFSDAKFKPTAITGLSNHNMVRPPIELTYESATPAIQLLGKRKERIMGYGEPISGSERDYDQAKKMRVTKDLTRPNTLSSSLEHSTVSPVGSTGMGRSSLVIMDDTPSMEKDPKQSLKTPMQLSSAHFAPPTPIASIPSAITRRSNFHTTPSALKPCGHSIHPAYAAIYSKSNCPMCLMDAAMMAVRTPQDIIISHGGARQWLEDSIYHGESETGWAKLMRGGRRKARPVHRDQDGRDVSYRYHKRLLLNLALEVETLSALEKTWEQEQQPENCDISIEYIRMRKQYSATSALSWYQDTMDIGFIGRLERDCQSFTRKRGREWEVSVDPDYPDNDSPEFGRFFRTTTAQQDFIEKSQVNSGQDGDGTCTISDAPPKRKRRRVDANVRFNPEAYVRSEADIDVLRKSATFLTVDFLDDSPKAPGPSVLRTEPLNIDPRPKRPYIAIPLKLEDGSSRSRRRSMRYKRSYRPGKYAPSDGYEVVDTSCSTMDTPTHFWYVCQLQQEAAEMDAMGSESPELTSLDGASGSDESEHEAESEDDRELIVESTPRRLFKGLTTAGYMLRR